VGQQRAGMSGIPKQGDLMEEPDHPKIKGDPVYLFKGGEFFGVA